MKFSLSRVLGVFAVSAILSACGDLPESPLDPTSAALRQSTTEPRDWNIDDEFERIAREEVPGFAGDYLLADGTPVVLLKDMAQRGAAERSVAVRRARAGMAPRSVLVRRAQYDFPTLREWRDRLLPAMEDGHAFALDVDETRNQVWVAVENASDGGAVRAAAARLGIPASALAVEVQGKPQDRSDLHDSHRPVLAGVQLANTSGDFCTLGFNALIAGVPVFVTNSHCSGAENTLDSSSQGQPYNVAGTHIGQETYDRAPEGCWRATYKVPCRKSDSSIFAYNAGVPYTLGRIARTTYYGANQAGSIEIDPLNPYFQITAKNTTGLSVGTWVDKVGRSSGWTRGQVQKSCVWLKKDYGIYYDCQYVTSNWSQKGDSGSPMFVVTGSGVSLHGLLWGGPLNDWTTTWYSPIGGIEKDFGVTLQVF